MNGLRMDLRPVKGVEVIILGSFLQSSSMAAMHVGVLVLLIPETFL